VGETLVIAGGTASGWITKLAVALCVGTAWFVAVIVTVEGLGREFGAV